jgi:hypothetical protein
MRDCTINTARTSIFSLIRCEEEIERMCITLTFHFWVCVCLYVCVEIFIMLFFLFRRCLLLFASVSVIAFFYAIHLGQKKIDVKLRAHHL